MPEEVIEDSGLVTLLQKLEKEPIPESIPEPSAPPPQTQPAQQLAPQAPVQEPHLVAPTPPPSDPPDLSIVPKSKTELDLIQLVLKFNEYVTRIIANHGTDRGQIEAAIVLLEPYIREALHQNRKISPAIVDSWTRLLQTKAEINSNATSALDSVAKLLAAIKNNQNIQTPQAKESNLDLVSILSQPKNEDEELAK